MVLKSDIKLKCSENRGIYHSETERAIVFVLNHESLDDLYATITHETLHHAIEQTEEDIDTEQEEDLIYHIQWANEWLT
jgi:hypothetical protein